MKAKTRQITENGRSIGVFLHRMLWDPNFALGSKLRNPSRPASEANIGMAQWLACWARNPKVRGSKPRPAMWSAMIACNPLFLASNLHFYELRATFPDCPGCVGFTPAAPALPALARAVKSPALEFCRAPRPFPAFPRLPSAAPTAGKVVGRFESVPLPGVNANLSFGPELPGPWSCMLWGACWLVCVCVRRRRERERKRERERERERDFALPRAKD
jgi:hypothetical protein